MIIEAELTWTGEQFDRGIKVAVDEHGSIRNVGPSDRETTHRLHAQALLPGFVNAHSQAFQRGLRGRGELFPVGSGSFWSWRQAMYELVLDLDATKLYEHTARAFREMRAAGITTVGEFHYLHHTKDSHDYAYDEIVLNAARNEGIRIALLNVVYRKGGIGKPLSAAQRRFESLSLDAYWAQMDVLAGSLDGSMQSLAAVAHSIRAVPIEEIVDLHVEAKRRQLPFHIHVEEQVSEIAQSIEAYGSRPMRALLDKLDIDHHFTAVHATHTQSEDLTDLFSAGGNVCITPLTEGNHGDGIPNTDRLHGAADYLSLGTDSNARISMLEEMRWLEYVHRLRTESRGVFRDTAGRVGKTLLEIATRGGARSLGVNAGRIFNGYAADFAAVDLNHPSLAGTDEESLLTAIIFGASEEVITSTCVGGAWKEHRNPNVS